MKHVPENDKPSSRADLERVLDDWNDTTGALPKDSGWRCEVLGMLQDAYDLGAQAAPTGNWINADDVSRLVRDLDIALHGEDGAASQAALCDVVGLVKEAARKLGSPILAATAAPIAYLQEADQHLLHRFIETTEDGESFNIGKDAVKRLANLGVVESCGFGRYGVTMFGYWVHEHYWHQNPSLPLKTNADRDREHRAAMAAAQECGQ